MRIGIFVASVAVRPGYEHIVSGHVQVPLRCAQLLAAAGHEVHIVTSEFEPSASLPAMLGRRVPLHQVPYGSRRRDSLVTYQRPGSQLARVNPLRTIRRLIRIAREQRFDVFHFFGASGTADVAGLVRALGARCPVVLTLNVGRLAARRAHLRTALWRRIDRILTTTEYFRRQLHEVHGVDAVLLRHGAVRSLLAGAPTTGHRRDRVLFWREASPLNGGDIGVEVFAALAPRYPQVSFDFAVRPHRLQPDGVEALARRFANVHLFTTPYPDGVTLEDLLAGSICVLQPFRAFTIQPQLSILESMLSGVPVVTTAIESSAEMIESGVNGILVPPDDVHAAIAAVESLLQDRLLAAEMGRRAAQSAASDWNWDTVPDALLEHYRSVAR